MTLRIDDADPDAVWEPWVPTVGQRVRMRPNRECRCPKCHGEMHDTWLSGVVGSVSQIIIARGLRHGNGVTEPGSCNKRIPLRGHRYGIRWRDSNGNGWRVALSAAELEPCEDEG